MVQLFNSEKNVMSRDDSLNPLENDVFLSESSLRAISLSHLSSTAADIRPNMHM